MFDFERFLRFVSFTLFFDFVNFLSLGHDLRLIFFFLCDFIYAFIIYEDSFGPFIRFLFLIHICHLLIA